MRLLLVEPRCSACLPQHSTEGPQRREGAERQLGLRHAAAGLEEATPTPPVRGRKANAAARMRGDHQAEAPTRPRVSRSSRPQPTRRRSRPGDAKRGRTRSRKSARRHEASWAAVRGRARPAMALHRRLSTSLVPMGVDWRNWGELGSCALAPIRARLNPACKKPVRHTQRRIEP